MRISLLHATYRAGPLAVIARDEWLRAAAEPDRVEHIFAFDADDEVSMSVREIVAGVVGPPLDGVSAVRNWNAAAKRATGDLLFVIADDLRPCAMWDTMLVEVVNNLDPARVPFVVKVRDTDDIRNHTIRHPVVARCYFERFGLWHPGYEGHWVDYDFTMSAHARGLVLDGRHVRFHHVHPSEGFEATESHKRMRSHESDADGHALFLERWPRWKHHIVRRYYRPSNRTVRVGEVRRRARGLMSQVGYLKGLVPERVRRRLRPAQR